MAVVVLGFQCGTEIVKTKVYSFELMLNLSFKGLWTRREVRATNRRHELTKAPAVRAVVVFQTFHAHPWVLTRLKPVRGLYTRWRAVQPLCTLLGCRAPMPKVVRAWKFKDREVPQ